MIWLMFLTLNYMERRVNGEYRKSWFCSNCGGNCPFQTFSSLSIWNNKVLRIFVYAVHTYMRHALPPRSIQYISSRVRIKLYGLMSARYEQSDCWLGFIIVCYFLYLLTCSDRFSVVGTRFFSGHNIIDSATQKVPLRYALKRYYHTNYKLSRIPSPPS